MLINGFTYLLNAGVGINAEVIDRTSRLGKSLFGRTAYVGTAVWKVLQAKPQHLAISIDGEEARTYDATDVLISNCGMLVRVLHPNCPDVRADDGQVDVCFICMKVAIGTRGTTSYASSSRAASFRAMSTASSTNCRPAAVFPSTAKPRSSYRPTATSSAPLP